MNTNPPYDNTPLDERFIVIHINRKDKKCLVRKEHGKKSFICDMADWLIDGIMLQDFVKIKKGINGKWIVTDYIINTEVYNTIHNSYQDNLDDMILDENGVPL